LVVSGSSRINDDILRTADEVQYGTSGQRLVYVVSPTLDVFNGRPLDQLLSAQWVILAEPLEYFWQPEHQRLVTWLHRAFVDDWDISRDFERLPETFRFSEDVTVTVYRRVRQTPVETATRTLQAMQRFLGRDLDTASRWRIANPLRGSYSTRMGEQVHYLWTGNLAAQSPPATSFAYTPRVAAPSLVSGHLTRQGCNSQPLSLAVLDRASTPLKKILLTDPSVETADFSVPVGPLGAGESLTLLADPDSIPTADGYCAVEVQRLTVAKR
jgi:hypothetical protein